MNKRFVFALAIVLSLFMCACAWADVAINSANFPDETFRFYVQYYIAGGESILTTEQAENTSIIACGKQGYIFPEGY